MENRIKIFQGNWKILYVSNYHDEYLIKLFITIFWSIYAIEIYFQKESIEISALMGSIQDGPGGNPTHYGGPLKLEGGLPYDNHPFVIFPELYKILKNNKVPDYYEIIYRLYGLSNKKTDIKEMTLLRPFLKKYYKNANRDAKFLQWLVKVTQKYADNLTLLDVFKKITYDAYDTIDKKRLDKVYKKGNTTFVKIKKCQDDKKYCLITEEYQIDEQINTIDILRYYYYGIYINARNYQDISEKNPKYGKSYLAKLPNKIINDLFEFTIELSQIYMPRNGHYDLYNYVTVHSIPKNKLSELEILCRSYPYLIMDNSLPFKILDKGHQDYESLIKPKIETIYQCFMIMLKIFNITLITEKKQFHDDKIIKTIILNFENFISKIPQILGMNGPEILSSNYYPAFVNIISLGINSFRLGHNFRKLLPEMVRLIKMIDYIDQFYQNMHHYTKFYISLISLLGHEKMGNFYTNALERFMWVINGYLKILNYEPNNEVSNFHRDSEIMEYAESGKTIYTQETMKSILGYLKYGEEISKIIYNQFSSEDEKISQIKELGEVPIKPQLVIMGPEQEREFASRMRQIVNASSVAVNNAPPKVVNNAPPKVVNIESPKVVNEPPKRKVVHEIEEPNKNTISTGKIIGAITVISFVIALFTVLRSRRGNDNKNEMYGGHQNSVINRWKSYSRNLIRRLSSNCQSPESCSQVRAMMSSLANLLFDYMIQVGEYDLISEFIMTVILPSSGSKKRINPNLFLRVAVNRLEPHQHKIDHYDQCIMMVNNFLGKSI